MWFIYKGWSGTSTYLLLLLLELSLIFIEVYIKKCTSVGVLTLFSNIELISSHPWRLCRCSNDGTVSVDDVVFLWEKVNLSVDVTLALVADVLPVLSTDFLTNSSFIPMVSTWPWLDPPHYKDGLLTPCKDIKLIWL